MSSMMAIASLPSPIVAHTRAVFAPAATPRPAATARNSSRCGISRRGSAPTRNSIASGGNRSYTNHVATKTFGMTR
jgi:hypothetical protein